MEISDDIISILNQGKLYGNIIIENLKNQKKIKRVGAKKNCTLENN